MRILVDSSTLIALAKIGKLNVLEIVFRQVSVTAVIMDEILREDSPEKEVFREAINSWINIIDYKGNPEEFRKYGLDAGEASLFLAAEADDRLVLDEANARRFAESKGLKFTGLIGLIVAAVKTKKLTRELALETISKLSLGDFRMSMELYIWALERIEPC
jgi:predicted nucleic acid-binding protein